MSAWLDRLRDVVVPLESAVPVVDLVEGRAAIIVTVDVPNETSLLAHSDQGAWWWPLSCLRLDLDHPQGVAYALRLIWPHAKFLDSEWEADALALPGGAVPTWCVRHPESGQVTLLYGAWTHRAISAVHLKGRTLPPEALLAIADALAVLFGGAR